MKSLGTPERGQALTRAYELCQQLENTPQLLTILGSVASWHRERGEIHMAQEIAAQRLTLAQSHQDVMLLAQAHEGLARELYFGGTFAQAHDHMQQALSSPSHQQGGPLVTSLSFLGRILWMLGYPDQAQAQSDQAVALAQEQARPEQLAVVLYQMAEHYWYRREPIPALRSAEASLVLATEQGFGHSIGHALLRRGWALAAQGRITEGLADLHQGLDYREAVAAIVGRSYDPIFLAEAYVSSGQVEKGLHVLAEMRVAVNSSGFCCLEAEIYRFEGELLLQQAIPNEEQAEANFEQALEVARLQQAKSWELRAATSLDRLWQSQNKCQDAYELLDPVYEWFTEGFETADLQEAKVLLAELRT